MRNIVMVMQRARGVQEGAAWWSSSVETELAAASGLDRIYVCTISTYKAKRSYNDVLKRKKKNFTYFFFLS